MKIKIKNKIISDFNKPFFVAEAGINYDGNFKKCFKLIDAAKKAGADAIKFQSHLAEHEMLDTNVTLAHSSKETVFQLMKKCELSESQHRKLKKYCPSCFFTKILARLIRSRKTILFSRIYSSNLYRTNFKIRMEFRN